ncbi:MAG TPA: DNA gyrase subunit A, partial [Egibacteraceae bacterium]|nr:DNA gyrase subunit A [Egibacteraceae bacterium]
LAEVIDACLALIRKPSATADELMKHVPAPDFPTGARIVGGDGIRDAYLTGRGAVTMEAVATTETRSGGLPRIVVTEIPFQVNKAALLERMADLVKDKKLDEIRDLRDESSREGMRVVIELKRGEDPARVLRKLYRLTDLRTNFNVNLVALVDGQPRTIGLREALTEYLAHQRTVLTRRTTYRKEKAEARAHVLEGLLVALDNLDAVIKLIRAAESADKAREQLMKRFSLTEVQATAILDMQLRRLAKLERDKVKAEHAELTKVITELKAILADPAKLDALLAAELKEIRARHANPRRSRLVVTADDAPDDDAGTPGARTAGTRGAELIVDEDLPELEAQPVTLYVTQGGYLKAVPRRRVSKPHSHPNDPVVAVLRATTEDTVLLIDADGAGYRIGVGDVPVTTMRQRGTSIAQLLGDGPDARIAGAVLLGPDVETVLTVSARGLVKRTERAEYEGRLRTMIAAGVRDDDELVAVAPCNDGDHIVLANSAGLVVRFAAGEVRPMGRGAAGVAGMNVPRGARIVSATVVPGGGGEDTPVLTVDADGAAKRTALGEYPAKGRGGKGVQTGAARLAFCGVGGDLHAGTAGGAVVLETAELPAGKRPGRLAPITGHVTGPVVAETGRD